MKTFFKLMAFWSLRLIFIVKKYASVQKPFKQESIRNILLVETALLGDVVAATALIGVIADIFPNARITFLVQEKFKALLQANPFIERVATLNRIEFKSLYRVVRTLRRSFFDLVVCVSPGVLNALLSLVIGRRYISGYLVNYSSRTYYYQNHVVDAVGLSGKGFYDKNEHITLRALKSILPLGPVVFHYLEPTRPRLYISKEKEASLFERLKGKGFFNATGINIVIHPGASRVYRQWSAERFKELITRLHSIYRQRLNWTLIGIPSEREIIERIEEGLPFGPNKLLGYDLDPVMVLLKHCDLFIGNDSGPKFIADAFNRPLIELLGPLMPSAVGALNESSVTIYHEVGCNPCPQLTCLHNGLCITSISVEEVLSAVIPLIERNSNVSNK